MDCVKNEACQEDTFHCCFTCEIKCDANNDCSDEECEHHPKYSPQEE